MMCPLMKKDRAGEWMCGGRQGKCQRRTDLKIECEIRDGVQTPAMKELSDGVQKIFRDAVGREI